MDANVCAVLAAADVPRFLAAFRRLQDVETLGSGRVSGLAGGETASADRSALGPGADSAAAVGFWFKADALLTDALDVELDVRASWSAVVRGPAQHGGVGVYPGLATVRLAHEFLLQPGTMVVLRCGRPTLDCLGHPSAMLAAEHRREWLDSEVFAFLCIDVVPRRLDTEQDHGD